ncbi:hypothetical protein [Paenibacillus sp. Mc5Re-14]|uniref:hypothetical protein n=1 Tax=Paenibacillus sp. Mc5Re-14 TaxID=1030529 RepID=UPI000AEA86A0|nr:hypothetical protein [Paenibacillus sp. Mc5Re-14]
MRKKEELIAYYERNLEKVKTMHDPLNYNDDLSKDKCNDFIRFAEKELEAVRNGREW